MSFVVKKNLVLQHINKLPSPEFLQWLHHSVSHFHPSLGYYHKKLPAVLNSNCHQQLYCKISQKPLSEPVEQPIKKNITDNRFEEIYKPLEYHTPQTLWNNVWFMKQLVTYSIYLSCSSIIFLIRTWDHTTKSIFDILNNFKRFHNKEVARFTCSCTAPELPPCISIQLSARSKKMKHKNKSTFHTTKRNNNLTLQQISN